MPTSWWPAVPRRAICRIGIAGFVACRALSTGFNDKPEQASRPWDRDRDGFVMGEGAGCVVLEELRARQAPRRQDLCRGHRLRHVGRRLPHHRARPRTATAPSAPCRRRCKRAGIAAGDIDYVNAHGTSTPLGDEIELRRGRAAVRQRGPTASPCPRPSRRSAICWARPGRSRRSSRILAMRDGIAPPTLNLENPSVESDIDLVPLKPRHKEINTVLSNSFGFGGTNASLIFRACA